MRKNFIFALLLFFIISLSGCWNYTEVKEFINVAGVAIDKGENERFKVTVETNKYPPGQSDKPVEPVLFSIEGKTVFQCLRLIIGTSGRKLYVGHMMVIIVSEDVAKEGIIEILDFFIRDHEVRLTTDLVVSRGCKAEDIFLTDVMQEEIASYEIDKLLDNTEPYSGLKKQKSLYQIYNDIFEEGIDPIIPALSIIDEADDKKTFRLNGLGCLKDDKLVGFIDYNYVPYYASFIDCYDGGVLAIPIGDNGKDGYISCEIVKAKTKSKVKLINDQFHIYFTMEINFTLGGNSTEENVKLTTFKPKDFERIFADDRKKHCNELLNIIRKDLDTDIIGVERYIYRKSYRNWKKYHLVYDFLQNTVIHYDIKAHFTSPGIIKIDEGEFDE
ncbi:MAG TPA: Ger(x)C family spore germination protein [Acholeplasmataceae bacterium]|nr:Ger(x)C family spore germination protein [Acholeplasmataceae bacterium]